MLRALLLLLLLPGLALADIVLHDGGVDRDAEVVELVRARTGNKPRLVLSSDVLAGPTRLLASNATLEQCEGAPIRLELKPKLDGVVDSVLSFELERAISELDVIETLLPCAAAPVASEDLARLAFLRGAARFDQGDTDGARQTMGDALALDPEFEGLKGFPQAHLDLLEEMRSSGEAPASGSLFSWHKPGTAQAVYVDGRPVDHPARQGVEVRAGRHLVQVENTSGQLRGLWVRTSGVDAVIVHPGAGNNIWEDGGRTPGGEMAMRLMLLSEFEGGDGDIHVIRWKGRRVVSAATFPAGGGVRTSWGPEETVVDAGSSARKPPSLRPSRVRFALGGGYQYVHPFNYGMGAVDLGVRLVGPLTVTAFARPSFAGRVTVDTGSGEPESGGIVLVPFGVGLSVQKHDGPVGPFVFGVFQGAMNQVVPLGSFMLGAAVQGGVDIAPGDGPFLIRIQGEAGILGADSEATGGFFPTFTGRVWVGAGARF